MPIIPGYKLFTVPIGIVLSSLSWWKGEWIGLTLIVDMKSILLELSEIPIKRFNINRIPNSGVIGVNPSKSISWGLSILFVKIMLDIKLILGEPAGDSANNDFVMLRTLSSFIRLVSSGATLVGGKHNSTP
ncbi:hypothetical protein NQ317_013658 [Molorchus minor]|uniref:Uncharacterized protein n=1 Tax=Molorchus minor TaxID=1323400 RepID=A0ABQ9J072_9CUCU|nr:hypothetical protein NQ317_013658 [Molorchus minor]